jgi:hypothetical protein
MPISMTNDADTIALSKALDADERATVIHEAGHAVVAHALGADLVFVEIYIGRPNPDDGKMGGGKTCYREPFAKDVKSLAVCVAGYRAELTFAAEEQELSKMFEREGRLAGDSKQMQELLFRFPEAERLAALVEGFRLADDKLKANADAVNRVADALFARRFEDKARIEGAELDGLLAGVRDSGG